MTRATTHREAIRTALAEAQECVSAQELHRRLVDGGHHVGLATVYRQLHALVADGAVDAVRSPDSQLYHAGGGGHHHHLTCEECGRTVEIDLRDEGWIEAEARRRGFVVSHYLFDVFGVCDRCREPA